MSLISVADIVNIGKGAYKLWEFGFSKCKKAGTSSNAAHVDGDNDR